MNSIFLEALDEYKTLTGKPFHDELYPTPASVPSHLLKVVSKVKVSQAGAQQMSIFYELQKYKQANIVMLPDEKKHLIDDFEECGEQMKRWGSEC